MQKIKSSLKKGVAVILTFCLSGIGHQVVNARPLNNGNSEGSNLFGIYFTVSLALLFTILTVYAILMLARYLRETTEGSYSGYKDSDC